ncbi:YrdB family protein [Deinococcus yavapaiensis]|uniref:Uncharacterized protein DUF2568 n=1 Tax=Deinococcus yavapaiensis KR-236 TaxID=694435 RepID=A0A318S6F4_9DEIO|nr:YrdB family protein [Deinococcus yavapaiensis]PYE50410.1 uncharacterized protein DUF2568 [Deinococcus yavapaiensis KR-236]
MEGIKAVNLGVRFVLELCLLAALAYWGWRTGTSLGMRVLLAVTAPLLAAVVWGALVSPRAPVRLPLSLHLLVQLFVFGAAVAALFAVGRSTLAWTLGLVALGNVALLLVWRQ